MATSITISDVIALTISSTLIFSIISSGEISPLGNGPTGIPASACLCIIFAAIFEGLNPGLAFEASIKGLGMALDLVEAILNKFKSEFKTELGFLKSVLFGSISFHFAILNIF
jgi:hypothetical protein